MGRYPTLIDRVCRTAPRPLQATAQRMLATEFMHRFLVWQGFSEMLVAVLPHLRLAALYEYARRWFPRADPQGKRRRLDRQAEASSSCARPEDAAFREATFLS